VSGRWFDGFLALKKELLVLFFFFNSHPKDNFHYWLANVCLEDVVLFFNFHLCKANA